MSAIIDIVRVSLGAVVSMLVKRARLPERAWSSEFTFRLAKQLIDESKTQPVTWLRERQALLTLIDGDLFKVSCQSEVIGKVECLAVTPKNIISIDKTIIYLHGGGYTVGSAKAYRLTLAKLAVASQAKVIGVEYRRAPEHEIPAAQEDCLTVSEVLIEQYRETSEMALILMGDSAGGALCLATLNALANADMHKDIAACVLISPWISPLDSSVLTVENEVSDILDRGITEHWKQNFYLHEGQKVYLEQMDIDPAILPSLYIQAAGAEVFIGQIDSFVAGLKQAGCELRYEVFEGQFHVFQTFAPLVREANDAIGRIGEFLKAIKQGT
jgi:epsilon-lactone hydrolase